MLESVEWGEYKLGELFEIESVHGINLEKLVEGIEYDYVTRTSINQGILRKSGFIDNEKINSQNVWSLGLLQMDFFYRENPWYAGQFIRKITPKIDISKGSILFFTTILNKQKKKLLSVLVRDVDKVFRESTVFLPVKNGKINFYFIEKFIAELDAQRIAELDAYLQATGLRDYELTEEETRALLEYNKISFEKFAVTDIFCVKNTSNILASKIKPNSGKTPYLCASAENNAVSSYIDYDEKFKEEGNCVFIGGKTFVVTYQEKDFYSNDSHNIALYFKNLERTKINNIFAVTCIKKSLGHKYSWGDSISKAKINKDCVSMPSIDGKVDFSFANTFITAIQKLVIKDVVKYTEGKIEATETVVSRISNENDNYVVYDRKESYAADNNNNNNNIYKG